MRKIHNCDAELHNVKSIATAIWVYGADDPTLYQFDESGHLSREVLAAKSEDLLEEIAGHLKFNQSGLAVDYWGSPLNFRFIKGGESSDELEFSSQSAHEVLVWSNGQNQMNENGKGDDRASWRSYPEYRYEWGW